MLFYPCVFPVEFEAFFQRFPVDSSGAGLDGLHFLRHLQIGSAEAAELFPFVLPLQGLFAEGVESLKDDLIVVDPPGGDRNY